jgi:hypothetical protein
MIYLKDAAGETIASGCKWSQPLLLHDWTEVDIIFDEDDPIVQLSGPSCRYEVWYKVGGKADKDGNHALFIDYFTLIATDDSSSPIADKIADTTESKVCSGHLGLDLI